MSRNNGGASPLSAGLIGALIGVIAGASAVFFSDRRNRKRVRDAVLDMEESANLKLDELKEMAAGTEAQGRKKLAGNLRRFATQLDSGKAK